MTTTSTAGVLRRRDDIGTTVYERLLRTAATSGRCPVWLGSRELGRIGAPPDPDDVRRRIGALDAAEVLRAWWPGPCPVACGCRDPFTDAFPDRLARSGAGRDAGVRSVEAAVDMAERAGPWSVLAVLDASRPADVPAVHGWTGIRDRFHQDLPGLSAVLRSWEDRFGALLVRLDAATLHLSVADPPRDRDECERVAAEHFAFCPDQQAPHGGPEWTVRRYGVSLSGSTSWCFRWD